MSDSRTMFGPLSQPRQLTHACASDGGDLEKQSCSRAECIPLCNQPPDLSVVKDDAARLHRIGNRFQAPFPSRSVGDALVAVGDQIQGSAKRGRDAVGTGGGHPRCEVVAPLPQFAAGKVAPRAGDKANLANVVGHARRC